MADAKTLNVNGTNYNIIDQTARDSATLASTNAEYDRQEFNGIYAGRNLNSLFSGQSDLYAYLGGLCDSGFGNLRIGDYFTVPVESNNLTARIAGMDTYLNAMDTQLTQHHLVCLFDPIAITDPGWQTTDGQYLYWADTASNQGTAEEKHPYLNSNLHRPSGFSRSSRRRSATASSTAGACLRSATARAATSRSPRAGLGPTSARSGRSTRWRSTAAPCGEPRATPWARAASFPSSARPRIA